MLELDEDKGFVELPRSILDHPLFKKFEYLGFFLYLFMKASHCDDRPIWNGKLTLNTGECFITLKKLREKHGRSRNYYRSLLEKMKKADFIKTKKVYLIRSVIKVFEEGYEPKASGKARQIGFVILIKGYKELREACRKLRHRKSNKDIPFDLKKTFPFPDRLDMEKTSAILSKENSYKEGKLDKGHTFSTAEQEVTQDTMKTLSSENIKRKNEESAQIINAIKERAKKKFGQKVFEFLGSFDSDIKNSILFLEASYDPNDRSFPVQIENFIRDETKKYGLKLIIRKKKES